MDLPIIIVCGDRLLAKTLIEALISRASSLRWVRTGEEGWLAFRQHGASVIITENALPHSLQQMTGLDLAGRIKKASPSTPVLMVDASPPEEASAVCDVVLYEPLAPRQLLEVLHALLIITDVEDQPGACQYLRKSPLPERGHVEPGVVEVLYNCAHPEGQVRLTDRGLLHIGPDGYFAAPLRQEPRRGARPCGPERSCYRTPEAKPNP